MRNDDSYEAYKRKFNLGVVGVIILMLVLWFGNFDGSNHNWELLVKNIGTTKATYRCSDSSITDLITDHPHVGTNCIQPRKFPVQSLNNRNGHHKIRQIQCIKYGNDHPAHNGWRVRRSVMFHKRLKYFHNKQNRHSPDQ